MYGDIWSKEDYLNWMYENLMAIKEVMSETASIYVHLDWHIGHYVKILMDEVFGEENFVNEIIWAYRSGGASKKASIARKHDSIYFYTNNSNDFEINTIKERQYLEKEFMGTMTDENGRFYVDTILTDTLSGVINRVMDDGTIKSYSCRPVLNVSKERVDYSTQKPEGLLELLIEIASKDNMVVADFFGGSGVTSKVANDLGRKFIHCDIGINSIQTIRDRLVEATAEFKLLEVQDGLNLFRNPIQTMDKLSTMIDGLNTKKPQGINSFWFGTVVNTKYGTIPVYIPDLRDSTKKVLDIVAINEIINKEIHNFDTFEADVKKVIVYFVDIINLDEIKKFIKEHNETLIEFELKDLKQVLDFVVVDDIVEYSLNEDEILFEVEINSFYSDRLKQKIDEYNSKQALKTKGNHICISEDGLELIEYISLDCTNDSGVWQSDSEVKIDKNGFVSIDGTKTKNFWDGKINSNTKPKRLKIRNIAGDEIIKLIK
ncbi:MAG: site-specific DNA-methyltransferase, partial [Campylobacterota bacterium]|nr:site-specific DNA-methyltransferase [Campylobacterota bacterium]